MMSEARITLMKLLRALGMTEKFAQTVQATLHSESEVKELLLWLKENRPEQEQEITEAVIKIRRYLNV